MLREGEREGERKVGEGDTHRERIEGRERGGSERERESDNE